MDLKFLLISYFLSSILKFCNWIKYYLFFNFPILWDSLALHHFYIWDIQTNYHPNTPRYIQCTWQPSHILSIFKDYMQSSRKLRIQICQIPFSFFPLVEHFKSFLFFSSFESFDNFSVHFIVFTILWNSFIVF